jgi:hypothetical protein
MENPLWGEESIANELLLKFGLRVSPRTVRKYMPRRPPSRGERSTKSWEVQAGTVEGRVRSDIALQIKSGFGQEPSDNGQQATLSVEVAS